MAIRVGILIEPASPHIENYLQAVAAATDVAEVAITDSSGVFIERAKRFSGASDKAWKGFATTRELLDQFRPELAVVSYVAAKTPPVVTAALEANCHVTLEKPACVRVADFAALVRLADSKHRNLMLAFANRATPIQQMARTLVADGAVGRPYAAHAFLVADQTRLKSEAYQKSWVARKAESMGGFFSWLSIHYVDLLQFVTRDTFTEVTAMIRNANRLPMDVEDSVVANLAMTSGLIATLHGGYYLDRGYQSGFQLWGTEGWLRMSPHGAQPRTLEWSRYATGRVESQIWGEDPQAYNGFVQSAVDSAIKGTPGLVTGAEGLHILETIEAGYRAAADGRTQRLRP